MTADFFGKTIVVTGASSGIGKAIAQKFLTKGAQVINFDLSEPDYNCMFKRVDIRNEQEIVEAFDQIGKLDVLVNNAGIYIQSLTENTALEDLNSIVDINIKGTYLMTKHALQLLKKSKGNIITISSGLGVVPESSSPAYCATKAALIMLTKCWAQEYAAIGVRVNAILPGPIDTPLLRKSFSSDTEFEEYKKLNPMKMIGKPEDVANVALFLAGDEASFVTAGLYAVDGGESGSSAYTK